MISLVSCFRSLLSRNSRQKLIVYGVCAIIFLVIIGALLRGVLPLSQSNTTERVGHNPAKVLNEMSGESTQINALKTGRVRMTNWALLDSFEFLRDSIPKVAIADVHRFLETEGKTSGNLIAGWIASGVEEFGKEALARAPDDPLVLFSTVFSDFVVPDERLGWIQRFQDIENDNPLPWLYEASFHIRKKEFSDGVAAIRSALGKPKFFSYEKQIVKAVVSIYRASGYSEAEASIWAIYSIELPHLASIKESGDALLTLNEEYRKAEDQQRMEDSLRLVYDLSKLLETPVASRTILARLTAGYLEERLIDTGAEYPWLPRNLGERLEKIKQTRKIAQEMAKSKKLYQSRSDALVLEYTRRLLVENEMAAWEWLQRQ